MKFVCVYEENIFHERHSILLEAMSNYMYNINDATFVLHAMKESKYKGRGIMFNNDTKGVAK